MPAPRPGAFGVDRGVPGLPDHWDVIEKADAKHPFRLATSPSREYLNSSFNEMPTSRAKHGPPRVKVHPDDLAKLGVADGGARAHGQRARRDRALPPRPSPACSAASSSSRASPPTTSSRAARASTRSPAPSRPRPTAARASTTTTCGSGGVGRNSEAHCAALRFELEIGAIRLTPIAPTSEAPMPKSGVTYVNPPSARPVQGMYSHVARMKPGEIAFIAGQVAIDAKGNPAGRRRLRRAGARGVRQPRQDPEGPRHRLRVGRAVHHLHHQRRLHPGRS